MRAIELHDHCKATGTWVNWDNTVDKFLVGDPETDVTGIAVSWMPTLQSLEKARKLRCNLFVTHEPLYIHKPDESQLISPRDPWAIKKAWTDENELVIYRCHDFWDDYPDVGIHGSWAKWLGFNDAPIASEKYYEVHSVRSVNLGELAEMILEKVKSLGQQVVHVVGDLNREVHRVAFGTGAITNYRRMHALGADTLILTDDGTRLWESGQWAHDGGASLILVNHATSEEPGMITLTNYIQGAFPDVHVEFIPTGCLYQIIT